MNFDGHKNFAIPYMSVEFIAENCFNPKALNTTISPIVKKFFNMNTEAIIKRYAQLNPNLDTAVLRSQLEYKTKHFKWAGQFFRYKIYLKMCFKPLNIYKGCYLFNVTNKDGKREMIIVESNSCPSGQKSMPLVDTTNKYGVYKTLIKSCLADVLNNEIDKSLGGLAVIYDKKKLESL